MTYPSVCCILLWATDESVMGNQALELRVKWMGMCTEVLYGAQWWDGDRDAEPARPYCWPKNP